MWLTPPPCSWLCSIMNVSQQTLDCVARNLQDIGALSFEDYLADQNFAPQPQPVPVQVLASTSDVNPVTRLHQACQRTFRNTDAFKFEFIEHSGSRSELFLASATTSDLDHRQTMHLDYHETRRRATFLRDAARLCQEERGKIRGCKNSH